MKTLLTCNLSTKTARDGAEGWSSPEFAFGETFTLGLRFLATVAGQELEPALDIRNLVAAVGFVDARPASGTFMVQVGGGGSTLANTTAAVQHDASAAALAAAINALGVTGTYGSAAVTKKEGSWFIVFGDGDAEVPLQLRHNELAPLCQGVVNASSVDSIWTHELRLVQLPVAFADAFDRVLPPEPTVTEIVEGGSSGEQKWNEVQRLFVSPDFRDTFRLKFGAARTALLDRQDDATAIQAALVAVLGDNVTVTNTTDFIVDIEFTNDLGGAAQALIEVLPLDPPPAGDPTLALAFTSAELLAALRASTTSTGSVTMPLEVRIWIDDALTEIVCFRLDVTILRPVQWPDLATTPRTDFLRKPSPVSYAPYSAGGVVTGTQLYSTTMGDGAATTFSIAHGLGTETLANVLVRENTDNGRVLMPTEYAVVIVDADSITLTFATAPTLAQYVVIVVSAATTTALAAHTHSIADIDGLQAILDSLDGRLDTIEATIPSTTPGVPRAGSRTISIPIDPLSVVWPWPNATVPADRTTMKARGLLPAIHGADASVGDLVQPLASVAANAGLAFANRIDVGAATVAHGTDAHLVNVTAHGRVAGDLVRFTTTGTLPAPLAVDTNYYVIATGLVTNAFEVSATLGGSAITFTTDGSGTHHAKRAGASLALPATLGRASVTLAAWEFAGCDGRTWYKLNRAGTTTSYFPADFEQELGMIYVYSYKLTAGTQLAFEFDLALQLIKATSKASMMVVIEVGAATSDTAPATTTANLADITWVATPLLAQQIILTPQKQTYHFGAAITRADDGTTMTAARLIENTWNSGAQAPASANFALRVRLIDFDTQNSVAGAEGVIAADFTPTAATISTP